ncbi:hypothetical protein [Flavobacterium sp.]|uniref:hypothetical protein n=1 Tax=Flavobacterium sp. TaxID=239 RepID=UPI00374DBF28
MLFLGGGGWLPLINSFIFNLTPGSAWLGFKVCFGVVFFIFTRAVLPRYRLRSINVFRLEMFSYFIFKLLNIYCRDFDKF